MRTAFVDYDARHEPKTTHFCICCQRDIDPRQPHRVVSIVDGGPFAVHPEDAPAADAPITRWPIGLDCARRLGAEWTEAGPCVCAGLTS